MAAESLPFDTPNCLLRGHVGLSQAGPMSGVLGPRGTCVSLLPDLNMPTLPNSAVLNQGPARAGTTRTGAGCSSSTSPSPSVWLLLPTDPSTLESDTLGTSTWGEPCLPPPGLASSCAASLTWGRTATALLTGPTQPPWRVSFRSCGCSACRLRTRRKALASSSRAAPELRGPQSARCLRDRHPDSYRDVRGLFLPDHLHAGGMALQPPTSRSGLPSDGADGGTS